MYRLTLIFLILLPFVGHAQKKYCFSYVVDPQDVTIVRDSFGVPHIFGKTDADCAYGLAWANAEDAFHYAQELLLIGKGMLGKYRGRSGAEADFFRHGIGAPEYVEENFYEELTPEFITYLEGYCQGINAYAEAHPDEVWVKKAFPVCPKDVMVSYMVVMSFMCDIGGAVSGAVSGKWDNEELKWGSNAYALKSSRTADNGTYLCINPHVEMNGLFTFYEAHLQSEQGLNITGATFQGGMSIGFGNNEHLGWAFTWNYFDKVDVYKLKMHPKKKLMYEVDGEWKKLEKRKISLKVKAIGKMSIPVPMKTYWSEFGPTFKSDGGEFYAVRGPAAMTMLAPQQFYYMNKATNFEEWKDAMRMQGVPLWNTVYADKDDNIFYVTNGRVPKRPEGDIDWSGVLPGNSTDLLWTDIYELDELPQEENPDCGYVFNTNNTPFNATCEDEEENRKTFPSYLDLRPGDNNRSHQFMEWVESDSKFTFDQFIKAKYNLKYPENSKFIETLQPLMDIHADKYPEISEEIKMVQSWDREADTNSVEATVMALTIYYIFDKKGYGDAEFVCGIDADEEIFIEGLTYAREHLLKYFGTNKVPLGHWQRLVRGDHDWPAPCFADLLAAGYPQPWKDGRFYIKYGDTYQHFVKFNEDGPEDIKTLVPFGNSLREDSPHNIDQAELYVTGKLKTMTLDKEEVMKNAVKTYHPGGL